MPDQDGETKSGGWEEKGRRIEEGRWIEVGSRVGEKRQKRT